MEQDGMVFTLMQATVARYFNGEFSGAFTLPVQPNFCDIVYYG